MIHEINDRCKIKIGDRTFIRTTLLLVVLSLYWIVDTLVESKLDGRFHSFASLLKIL